MSQKVGYIEKLAQLADTGEPFVAVTLVGIVGSAPQEIGSKMMVDRSGLLWGTVGGGRIEHHAIEHARQLLSSPPSARGVELVEWNLQTDIGMTCGGVVRLLFECVNHRKWNIVIFGAGHVAAALVRALLPLECQVSVFDTREQWLEKIPVAAHVKIQCSDDLAAVVPGLPAESYVILMTMGHGTDLPVLAAALRRDNEFPYLGVIGSGSKRGALERELREEGIDVPRGGKFVCPIGLSLGGNEPAEIAISIAAQLLSVRDQHRQAKLVE